MLALVPCRAGSVGVPEKALRTVGGIPLVLRTLRCVEASGVAERIVVTTDCPKVKSFCELRGYEVLDRPAELGADDVPLIAVARHAVGALRWGGTVGIFQATCPLLSPETVRAVCDRYNSTPMDWAITAYEDPHIHWWQNAPLVSRLQRQDLADLSCESGAVQLMSAEVALDLWEPQCAGLLPIPEREALDIDTPDDLMLAERLCSLRRIHFVVLAPSERTGTGHFHRSLALATALAHHDVTWEWVGATTPETERLIPWHNLDDNVSPDVVVFDRLAVPAREVLAARARGQRVVVLEDESADATLPDLLVNALLDPADVKYADVRSEFLGLPEREHRAEADRVLVTFGGTDPASLGDRCFGLLDVGWLVGDKGEVRNVSPGLPGPVSMAEEMRWADLVITGQGRTVFEAAASSTPCISVAQNEREARHIRLPGVVYLGHHATVTDDQIRHAVTTMLADPQLRAENARAARRVVDGRGLDRLVRRIEGLAVT